MNNYKVVSANFARLAQEDVYASGMFENGTFFTMTISKSFPFAEDLYIYDEDPENDVECNGLWALEHCVESFFERCTREDDRIVWRVLGVLLSRMKTDADRWVSEFGKNVYEDFLPIYQQLFSKENEATEFCDSDWDEMRKICLFEHKASKTLDHILTDEDEMDTKVSIKVGNNSFEWYMSPASYDAVEKFIQNIKEDIRGEF